MTSFASGRSRHVVRRLRVELGLLPEALRGLQRINIEVLPPYAFVTAAMDLAMVTSAQRNGIFIAHLSTHGALFREFEVMCVRWLTTAGETRLGGHKP